MMSETNYNSTRKETPLAFFEDADLPPGMVWMVGGDPSEALRARRNGTCAIRWTPEKRKALNTGGD